MWQGLVREKTGLYNNPCPDGDRERRKKETKGEGLSESTRCSVFEQGGRPVTTREKRQTGEGRMHRRSWPTSGFHVMQGKRKKVKKKKKVNAARRACTSKEELTCEREEKGGGEIHPEEKREGRDYYGFELEGGGDEAEGAPDIQRSWRKHGSVGWGAVREQTEGGTNRLSAV